MMMNQPDGSIALAIVHVLVPKLQPVSLRHDLE